MNRSTRSAIALAFLMLMASAGVAGGRSLNQGAELHQAYRTTVTADQLQQLTGGGYDVASVKRVKGSAVGPRGERQGLFRVDLVLYPSQARALRARGLDITVWRHASGRTARQLAAAQGSGGYNVWKDYDGPDGLRAEMYQIAADNPDIVKLEVIGHSHQDREIIALKVTEDAGTLPDGSRPAVLYNSLQHAREWISGEVTRRLLHWYIDRYRAGAGAIVDLLGTTELWFLPVANPDGYQYTFDVDRLWRKNLRDNNGDNQITGVDGVDPNRNFPTHWGLDEEGSASEPSDETYRGPGPASEPETQAFMGLVESVPFAFDVNYHSYGELILYSQGWQEATPAADDPVNVALAGTDHHPAIAGFDPGVGAELYITNGDTIDWAHGAEETVTFTPELGEGNPPGGFVFPDSEVQVQRHFELNLPFARRVARAAADPDDPPSWIDTQPFYLETSDIDLEKTNNPIVDFSFATSYGDPQPVRILAKRALGPVTLLYKVNGGPTQSAPTSEWDSGQRFGDGYDVHYHVMEGQVTGTEPGDRIRVWFTGGGEQSEAFTYRAERESDAPVLVMAAEDYSGISNLPYASTRQPNYLSYYEDALQANGIDYEVYDVDGHNRTAPSHLGVLGHFDSVIWYTANDVITREPGMVPGTASRLAQDEMLEVRSYLNEGGSLLYTGQYAGNQYAFGYEYDPEQNAPCNPNTTRDGCVPLRDDFFQYYLGAYIYNDDIGTNHDTGDLYPVVGVAEPFQGTGWSFNGPDSAQNQVHSASFLSTSSILDPAEYPQFTSDISAEWDRPGGDPYEPFDGDWYLYSQRADVSYKRVMREIDLTGATNPTLTFPTSYDTEPAWDFLFVEIHSVDGDDWTTLEEQNGHTSQDTGLSCPEGWEELHPFLVEHYQGSDCSGQGTTGEWWAASGRSAGWEQWEFDLSDWVDEGQVEISISYASDWATQGLGVFLDQVEVSTGEGTTSFEDDGDQMDGWSIEDSPPGSDPNPNNWIPTEDVGFEEGAVVNETPSDMDVRTLYFGFGFEGITSEAARTEVMDRAMSFLLGT